MLHLDLTLRPKKLQLGRTLFFVLALLFLAGGWSTPTILHAKNKARTSTKASSKTPKNAPAPSAHNADALLAGIYADLVDGRLKDATAKADRLVDAYPNFYPGHLLRGDLLLMHTRPLSTIGEAPETNTNKLAELRAEVMVRLKALRYVPDPDLLPRAFIQLRPEHKYALMVDTANSRVYVYQHKSGKLTLKNHFYISHGKLGVHKLREGDQKTPIGIYRITGKMARGNLPDFYGAGALPLNYPNEWDKLHERGGSGIWLHGMPSTSFSRPPLASDGCVALTNPDMETLLSSSEMRTAPVIISDRVELVNAAVVKRDRKTADLMLDQWRRDAENGDAQLMARNYSAEFKSGTGEDLPTWLVRQYPPANQNVSIKLRDLALFHYPGERNMVFASFTQEIRSGKSATSVHRRQYWAKEGSKWKIVHESRL
ncbi:MAG: L,D-transpeptidase family protein [Burkholderiaceae bacterium]|nr:L,D-transpeptidase family protein [Burkholderiaceae bacterium]